MPLFDRYLFADYSGGGENHNAQAGIRLYQVIGNAAADRLFNETENNQGNPQNFNRDELRERVVAELDEATQEEQRVIFGFDHQYGWPTHLRQFAGINDLQWREALHLLDDGHPEAGLPELDIPSRYCFAFNQFCEHDVFWSPLNGIAALYQIAGAALPLPDAQRFRLTELADPLHGAANPAPADAVGGQGAGIVGGQTICGLHQIRLMLDIPTIAWWPFDGLNINDDAYTGMHVGIEIYPSALLPDHVPHNDDNDAEQSCLYVRNADHADQLANLMTLHAPQFVEQIQREGWIVGMDPANVEGNAVAPDVPVNGQIANQPAALQAVMERLAEHEQLIGELIQRIEELEQG